MQGIRGILFDNDGTLVDTEQLIFESFRHAVRTVLGRDFPDSVFMHKVGQPLGVQMWDFTDDPAVQQELVRVYREHNQAHHDQTVRAFEGIVDGLANLKQAGFKLGVVTGKRRSLAWRGLEITGCAPYLECCIGADDCREYKPDPAPVLMGARALGLDPGECAYAGDGPFDIAAGKAAGCTAVACLWGMFPREELLEQGPDCVCESPGDLFGLFLETR